jgi:membrane-associated phospholipid phosphatase
MNVRAVSRLIALACFPAHTVAFGADFTTWVNDTGAYVTAPVHWDARDWLEFGATVATVGVAHHYDDDVRSHFAPARPADLEKPSSHELRDAAPAVALMAGSWALSRWESDPVLSGAAADMFEAAVLSSATAFVLKTAAGRERPYETRDANAWRHGGSSFPSLHATAAFAIGSVFAESGGDYYRLLKRIIGYGIGAGTAYLRVHNRDHWLSDVVAGAGLGEATGRFIVNRHNNRFETTQLMLVPVGDGVALQFSMDLR